MSQESRIPRIHIKRCVELSSLQNEPSSAHNEPESSETSKKIVDISSLKEKYNIRLPRSYKEQTSASQTVHFSEELESTIPETVDELKTENQKLKKEIAELKRQNSQMEIDFEEKLEKSQENINQMKEEIDFLANINQQFGAENDQLIKNLDRFRKYRIPESISVRSSPGDSGTESEIIPSKHPKRRKLKSKKIAKTNKGKRVFGNDSEEDTESDDEKNEKDARKKLRRIKAAKELFRKNDPNIIDYDKESLLRMLADHTFHSPEMSDTDEKDHSKTVVNVYDLSWRSAEVKSRIPRIHIKRCVELSSLQNEPSSAHNEPESSETSKKIVDISSLKEKYNIRLPRSYKEQTSASQTVHFSEELESTIPETVDELKTENQKLKKEIAELKRQNSQMEIDFEEKLEKSQENINQMKEEIDFLANINQQFGAENDQLIKNLDRFRKYRIPESISVRSSPGDSGTESEIIPSKHPKRRKLKSKKIAKTNKGKRVFGNDSEEDTESDDEKNEKDARKKLRRIKAAKELFRKNDPNIIDYDKESLLRMLADHTFHSPEMSDTDEKDHSKTVVNVYDLSWRSAEVSIYF
ncbi:hypothetical protein Glove_382g52 [Diversispora epigaea]|uniref:Uncharacterized protein n=1 Tax=Diversispora epigaea TaxID=1348612 RepID=A0A397H7F9_9GLOM|nr:hypothetical protein Glove_382g52 [Diversispora epigaea]